MFATVAEIVGALVIGIGVGAVVGPLMVRYFRTRWLPDRESDRAVADKMLDTANELCFKLKVQDRARREVLQSEGRVKAGNEGEE
jgi:hypothetical protein